MVAGLEEGVSSSGHVGPMPFRDLAGVQEEDDGQDMSTPREDDEYAGIISALPTATNRFRGLCQYQGAWMLHRTVAGVISIQRRFVPRPGGGDVLLATPPKCGTTWVKALSFATMARAAYPPSAGDHPLLRLNRSARLRPIHGGPLRRRPRGTAGGPAVPEAHAHAHAPRPPASLPRPQPGLQNRIRLQGAQGYDGFPVALHQGRSDLGRPYVLVLRRLGVDMRGQEPLRPLLGPPPRLLESQQSHS